MTNHQHTQQRDELAQITTEAFYTGRPNINLMASGLRLAWFRVTDAILADGYRKPRTITTVEELDGEMLLKPASYSAPFYSPRAGAPLKNVVTGVCFSLDELAGGGRFFPATVLWEPEAGASL